MSHPNKPGQPCFIDKMQMGIINYRIDKIKRLQQEQSNQLHYLKQKNAKLALIELDQNQRNRSIVTDLTQLQGWNPSMQKEGKIVKETDRHRQKVKENERQRVTIITLANPERRFPFRSVNNRHTAMDAINEQNNVIPHLKTLLERLSSPVKKRKENRNFLSQRTASSSINCINPSLKIRFRNQREKDLTKQTKQNMNKFHEFKDHKQFRTPQTRKQQINDEFVNFSQGRKTQRQNFHNGETRASTSNAHRACFNSVMAQKQGIFTLKTIQVETEFPQQQRNKHNPTVNSETQPLKNHNQAKYTTNYGNFQYSKIKRKHPSAYEIDIAYEKQLLHQLIKGNHKPNLKFASNNTKPDSSCKKRNAVEKFTLKNLLQ